MASLPECEQSQDLVILHDGSQFSGEGLTDDEWKNNLLFGEQIGRILTAKVRWSQRELLKLRN